MTGYLLLCLSWGLFGTLHSLTAANGFKQRTHRLIPPLYYRLCYNGLALLTFVPVLLALHLAPSQPVVSWTGSYWMGGYLVLAGTFLSFLALKHYDLAEFIGWPVDRQLRVGGQLKQSGLLKFVRHPLYLGTLVGLVGLLTIYPYWKYVLFDLAAFAYIRAGIYFEEQKLIQTFGRQYLLYRERVPMLIPTF